MEAKALVNAAARSVGYAELKEEQERAILSFLNGKDVFVSLPTGYGKSLCYGLLPKVFDMLRETPGASIAMVVSPLIALMKDQVDSFTAKGIKAGYVSDKEEEKGDTRRSIQKGECQLIFISPEALFGSLRWRRMLCTDHYRQNLVAFVVDEAHCVQKW